VAIADMFLKVHGVTGEAADAEHKGEIEVVSWSWGMSAADAGVPRIAELNVVKRVDHASATLMNFLRTRKVVSQAQLTVRKAGKVPLTYFKIELENVRVMSLKAQSDSAELVEHVSLGFSKVRVSYTPQGPTGTAGGGTNVFEAETHVSS
jgi:type VI secretion system secreted protein Hcp